MRLPFIAVILLSFSSCNTNKSYKPKCYSHIFRFQLQNSDTAKIYGFTEFNHALICAKQRKRNLLLLFSGWALGRRNMEWEPLELFGNIEFLQEQYVIAWLAVDDRRKLPENANKNPQTAGGLNTVLQSELTNTASQPLYCIIDTNMKRIGGVLPYTKDKNEIKNFFMAGVTK